MRHHRAKRLLPLVGTGVLLLLLVSCDRPGERTFPERIEALALPAPLPPYGTERPLDSLRLAAVLSDADWMRAIMSAGTATAQPSAADAARLLWLWRIVGNVEAGTNDDWIDEASSVIAETAADYRAWPVRGATGPAAEAAQLERVPDSELMALAARRQEITSYFDRLYARGRGGDPRTVRASDPEALGWLLQTEGDATLASNRFDSADEAADFVRALYAAGATNVVVATESIREEAPRQWYADALRIALPGDPRARAAIFRMLNAEIAREGFALARDEGQAVLFMWWD